jgi:hypothetical protein
MREMAGSARDGGNQVTDWSFDHVAEARAALRMIVSDSAYGAAALSNVRIMSDLLPRLLGGAPLERSVLVTAASEDLPDTMLKHVSEGMDVNTAIRLAAHSLAAISQVPLGACYWVAAELALALSLITAEQADEIGSGGGSAAPSEASGPVGDRQSDGEQTASRLPTPESAGVPSTTYEDESATPEPSVADDAASGRSDPYSRDAGDGQPAYSAGGYPGAYPGAGYGQPGSWEPAGAESQQPAGAQPTQMMPGPPAGASSAGAPAGPRPVDQGYAGSIAAARADDWVSRAVREIVQPGLLAFNPPPEMLQGRTERIEVGVARSPELRHALTAGFRGRGLPEVVQVGTSPVMGVELRGSSFEITGYSPLEQLVAPLARWEFDVTPVRAGNQTLTLCVSLRINSPFAGGGQIAVPVLERKIRIRVDVSYGTRRFVMSNWQWLIATALGLGGAVAAWVALFH